ncbi:SLC13 family permease [Desulfurococcus amylolyticus]|uniref:SLC13 family permease n=1 Tax=Desulfurococcus amylolyticus TaxID=94694 RepID=UPI0023F0B594|nr:DASS family sodium-coupled anion symporter [Desulfurococcus amylolyticus]
MNTRLKLLIAVLTLMTAHLVASASPIGGLDQRGMAMLGIALLALVYWSTECVPIPVTGLIVMLLLTLYGIFPFSKSVSFIASKVNILIIAGLVISAALSTHKLDKLLGLKVLSLVGVRVHMVVLGMMLATALISMLMSNTAAAALMAPVAVSILSMVGAKSGESNLGKALMIGIAYAATIGGIGTPVGTPPVPITIGNIESSLGIRISFVKWMIWGVPIVLALTLTAWRVLLLLYPPEREVKTVSREAIERELRSMGPLTLAQKRTIALMALAVILWLIEPLAVLLLSGQQWVLDWTYVVSLLVIMLFFMPGIGVLEAKQISELDWGVVFLVAGGLALGEGLRETGILKLIADSLKSPLQAYPPSLVSVIIAAISVLGITVICSITATSATMVPLAISVAKTLGMDPRTSAVVAVAAGLASCYAFLLPANTPPNAITYSYGYFKSYEMAKAGVIVILAGIALIIVIMPLVSLLI